MHTIHTNSKSSKNESLGLVLPLASKFEWNKLCILFSLSRSQDLGVIQWTSSVYPGKIQDYSHDEKMQLNLSCIQELSLNFTLTRALHYPTIRWISNTTFVFTLQAPPVMGRWQYTSVVKIMLPLMTLTRWERRVEDVPPGPSVDTRHPLSHPLIYDTQWPTTAFQTALSVNAF